MKLKFKKHTLSIKLTKKEDEQIIFTSLVTIKDLLEHSYIVDFDNDNCLITKNLNTINKALEDVYSNRFK